MTLLMPSADKTKELRCQDNHLWTFLSLCVLLMCMADTLKRKQFILPQEKLDEVKRMLHAKTEREAVLLSLESVLKKKGAEEIIDLAGKVDFRLTHTQLKRQRRNG